MDDKKIIELFLQRSEKAISEISVKYGSVSMKTAYNILENQEDAEECVNDAYLGIWNCVPPQNPDPLLAFLLKIVRNISINRYKYNLRKKRNSQYDVCVHELDYCLSSEESNDDEIDAEELTKLIEEFLDGISKTNRMIFIRRYWYVDSYETIARLTGLKENTVRTRLSRTRSDLKKYLKKQGVQI